MIRALVLDWSVSKTDLFCCELFIVRSETNICIKCRITADYGVDYREFLELFFVNLTWILGKSSSLSFIHATESIGDISFVLACGGTLIARFDA